MAALDAARKERCADGSDSGEATGGREPRAIGRFGLATSESPPPPGLDADRERATLSQSSALPAWRRAVVRWPAAAGPATGEATHEQDAFAVGPERRAGTSGRAATRRGGDRSGILIAVFSAREAAVRFLALAGSTRHGGSLGATKERLTGPMPQVP
mgnify:CR=1 FL=1